MTHQLTQYTSSGPTNRYTPGNPVSKSGRVVFNGTIDRGEIRARREKSKRNDSMFPASVDDEAMSINRNELLYSVRCMPNDTMRARTPHVLSTLNGAFRASDTHQEAVAQVEFMGISSGMVTVDSEGNSPTQDIAIEIGGLNTIKNSGPVLIGAGTLVYWEIPSTKISEELVMKTQERLGLWTMPYRPEVHSLTADTLRDIALHDPEGYTRVTKEVDQPLIQGAKALALAFSEIVLMGWHAALASGLFVLNQNQLADPEGRAVVASEYNTDDKYREEVLTALAAPLGLLGSAVGAKRKRGDRDIRVRVPPATETGETTDESLADFLANILFVGSDQALCLPRREGTKKMPSGNRGTLITNQLGIVSNALAGCAKANEDKTSRIFVKALTTAKPNQDMDVVHLRYAA